MPGRLAYVVDGGMAGSFVRRRPYVESLGRAARPGREDTAAGSVPAATDVVARSRLTR
jgi:hypothetical protein